MFNVQETRPYIYNVSEMTFDFIGRYLATNYQPLILTDQIPGFNKY